MVKARARKCGLLDRLIIIHEGPEDDTLSLFSP